MRAWAIRIPSSRGLFDPTYADSAAYNPLLEVRRGKWEVRGVQNIADVLVDPDDALERRNHWTVGISARDPSQVFEAAIRARKADATQKRSSSQRRLFGP